MDLVFRGELRPDVCRRRFDWLREVSSLSERAILHLRAEVGAGALDETLPLGLASVFIRCRALALFVIVEAMTWANKRCSA